MMRLSRVLQCSLMAAAIAVSSVVTAASSSQQHDDERVVVTLLEAISDNDYERFVSAGTPAFASLPEPQFQQVAQHVGPRVKQGYELTYFGQVRQQGLDISVWRVRFDDRSDDLLATLNTQDGKVGGFYLR